MESLAAMSRCRLPFASTLMQPASSNVRRSLRRPSKLVVRASKGQESAQAADVAQAVDVAEKTQQLNKYSARITQPKSQGASQAMLYGVGLTEEDMNKPQVTERRERLVGVLPEYIALHNGSVVARRWQGCVVHGSDNECTIKTMAWKNAATNEAAENPYPRCM